MTEHITSVKAREYGATKPKAICGCGHTGDGANSEHIGDGVAGMNIGHGACGKCVCEHFHWYSWTAEFTAFWRALAS